MSKKVFILEDNADLIELFTILLEEENFQVKACESVKKFNQLIEIETPDIFLLDVMLLDGNGIEVCKSLKENPKTAHIPIVMTSANYNVADIQIDCDADAFIAKPFHIDDFIAKFKSF